ncbi:hypothetical protein D1007_16742 [Hordeum vulgare]|nr:hypothetical protein D1007_16742 [Hordeum vulgare]
MAPLPDSRSLRAHINRSRATGKHTRSNKANTPESWLASLTKRLIHRIAAAFVDLPWIRSWLSINRSSAADNTGASYATRLSWRKQLRETEPVKKDEHTSRPEMKRAHEGSPTRSTVRCLELAADRKFSHIFISSFL